MESPEKENLLPNDDIVQSSQGSPLLQLSNSNTQRLHLELDDDTETQKSETQITSSPTTQGEKRTATSNLSEMEVAEKNPKLDADKSIMVEGNLTNFGSGCSLKVD